MGTQLKAPQTQFPQIIAHQLNRPWANWSESERCVPAITFFPKRLEDLISIANFANQNGKKIRVVTSGHSWSALVPTDELLVDVTQLNTATLDLADPLQPRVVMECGATVAQVNTLLEAGGYTLPFNVVLESVRYGGLIATGSHGSGWHNQTLSDLVHVIEIVTASGELRRFEQGVDSDEVMNAARLNLGMFGIIYRITLNIQRNWRVHALDQRIPIPDVLNNLKEWVETHDNVDFFWWPFCDQMWVKRWQRVEQPITTSPRHTLRNRVGAGISSRLYRETLRLMANVSSTTPTVMPLVFVATPSVGDKVVNVVEAIHYRRSIEVTKMGCVEVAFKVDPDFANVRHCMQVVLDTVRQYAKRGQYPMNVTMNVRFIHNSNCWLSPAYGEGHTCYIEILSRKNPTEWHPFSAEVALEWLKQPQARPHWAKEYRHIPGIIEHIRGHFGENIQRFNTIKQQLQVDPQHLFVNAALQEVFLP